MRATPSTRARSESVKRSLARATLRRARRTVSSSSWVNTLRSIRHPSAPAVPAWNRAERLTFGVRGHSSADGCSANTRAAAVLETPIDASLRVRFAPGAMVGIDRDNDRLIVSEGPSDVHKLATFCGLAFAVAVGTLLVAQQVGTVWQAFGILGACVPLL